MKFIYLADTHIGGSLTEGYCQQKRYLQHIWEIFKGLGQWLDERPEIDFIIHGGDMVDSGTEGNILLAKELFSTLPRPCFLALGNHDLTEVDSLPTWLRLAPEFFSSGQADYNFLHGQIRFDILTAHWGKQEFFWNPAEAQIPWLSKRQLSQLKSAAHGKQRILITHAPPCGLPEGQTGMLGAWHSPAGNFEAVLQQLSEEHNLALILGAHNHANLAVKGAPEWLVTASAFVETPFEFKLFEITDDKLKMETISLVNVLPFRSFYDHSRSYVQGRPCDRNFSQTFA